MNDYWVVSEKSTGRVICHCGEEKDAIMMLMLGPNRVCRKQKFIVDQVINVTSSGIKELPGQQGLPAAKTPLPDLQQQIWLPESQAKPINTK